MNGPGTCELTELGKSNEVSALIDLASNDYLNLSKHPRLLEAATKAIAIEGVSSCGSRLVTGTRKVHQDLENALAQWLHREHVLLFPSGFQANIAAVVALANRHTTVLADRYLHHSLLLGVKTCGARLQRFSHNDLTDLTQRLKKCKSRNPKDIPLVITESLFSMEGSTAPIKEIATLCDQFGANLLVDEAHALGVMGPEGKGLCYGINEPIKIVSGTFGKAFGSGGAFLASNAQIGDQLIQNSGAFKYTTALAPPLAAAALAALQLMQENPNWGSSLISKSQFWRSKLVDNGWEKPAGDGPIIPLIIGSDQQALDVQEKLEQKGILSIAIRPPTVPEGTARLRLVVRKGIPHETLSKVLEGLAGK